MLTIIHGADIVASRKFFLNEKQRFADSVFLRQDEVSLTHLAQILDGGGLFEDSKTLFIEQFLTEKKKSAEKDAIIEFLIKQAGTHTITLWEGKEHTTAALNAIKGAKIEAFKLSSSLFTFLDAIKPGNGKTLINLFHQTLETTEPEMIFFMLIRQMRVLLCLSDGNNETISEVSRMSPWQKSKVEKQVKSFDKELLRKLFAQLFEIEIAQKTGGLASSLISAVDFFLIQI